jgi:hypothetical protein
LLLRWNYGLYDFLADHDREDLNKVIAELFKLSAGVLVFQLGSDSAKEQLVWPSESEIYGKFKSFASLR